jgi:hypothetical protein
MCRSGGFCRPRPRRHGVECPHIRRKCVGAIKRSQPPWRSSPLVIRQGHDLPPRMYRRKTALDVPLAQTLACPRQRLPSPSEPLSVFVPGFQNRAGNTISINEFRPAPRDATNWFASP